MRLKMHTDPHATNRRIATVTSVLLWLVGLMAMVALVAAVVAQLHTSLCPWRAAALSPPVHEACVPLGGVCSALTTCCHGTCKKVGSSGTRDDWRCAP